MLLSGNSHKIRHFLKRVFPFGHLPEMGLIMLVLFTSACFEESQDETTTVTASSLDTEIKRSDYTGQYHHVEGCPTCHAADSGDSTNVALIRHVIDTPNSGPKPVVFTSRTGTNSFADGDGNYDGPCEVCHTQNQHHNNDGHDLTSHMDGTVCTQCHLHNKQFAAPHKQAHQTHVLASQGKGPNIDCKDCHLDPLVDPLIFADGRPLATTTVCDACHSPGGSYPRSNDLFDPVVGAKANFTTGGIYNEDGLTLKPGKEKWCATCHDEQQSISAPNGAIFTYAPNVVGNNKTYGYWATGHGKSIDNCLECHDASKKHFDHEHRTYEIDETTGDVVNPWGDSFRLRTSNTVANEQLCVKCHDQGALRNNGNQSNYTSAASGHDNHIWSNTLSGKLADSDYDGAVDSRPGCVTCHNVHGSKSPAMVRTGELVSTPGTNNRGPGIDLLYLKSAPGPFSTATWRPTLPSAGTYGVYGWWKYNGGMGVGEYTIHHDGGTTTVSHSQSNTGGTWVSMGSYSFSAGTSGYVELSARLSTLLLIADKMGFDSNGDGTPDIIIDDTDPKFSSVDEVKGGSWPVNGWSEGRAINYNEGYITADTLAESTAGYARFGSATVGWNKGLGGNKTCDTCHGAFIYSRTPFMGPKVINRFEEKRWALNDGAGVADIVVSVTDPDGDMAGGSVTIDVSSFGGSSAEAMTNNGDGTYSYQLPIPPGTADRSYALPITATDAAGNVGLNVSSSVFVKSAADNIYLDNADVIHGDPDNWLRDILSDTAYRGSYITTWNHRLNPDESALTATWKPQIKTGGTYKVYAWLQKSTIWNQNAVYTVQHRGGVTPIAINQNTGAVGGDWMLLGTFSFDAGDAAAITLTGSVFGLHGQLYVDALKLEPAP